MLRMGVVAILAVALLFAGLAMLKPAPIEPVSWTAPRDKGYAGPHAVNDRLARLRQISLGKEHGPEHVALGKDGFLYAAVADGKILRMKPDGSAPEVWAETGGRVLGFAFNQAGSMFAADSRNGLLLIEPRAPAEGGRRITVLADKVRTDDAADPIRFADAVAVAGDGKVYFTDASRRFSAAQWGEFDASVLDILEHSATGRVLVYDPASSKVSVVASGLSFANGLALSTDETSIFVVETGEYRIWKLASAARGLDLRKMPQGTGGDGQASVILSNLPGYPDNLTRGMNGRMWVGLAKPRSTVVDNLAEKPFLRKLVARLPHFLWPVPPAYGHVVAFDESGKVILDLQDPAGLYPETTGVTETADRLYIQSLHAPVLGWLLKSQAGL
jgi:sugar lactone lactonase YvrE